MSAAASHAALPPLISGIEEELELFRQRKWSGQLILHMSNGTLVRAESRPQREIKPPTREGPLTARKG